MLRLKPARIFLLAMFWQLGLPLSPGSQAPVQAALGQRPATQTRLSFDELLRSHQRSMKSVAEFFATGPVQIESVEGDLEEGERIISYWQDGRFRQEYHWLGFTEVFAWNGAPPNGHGDHWYGSELNLPYSLDSGSGPEVTAEFVSNFHYLSPGELPRISALPQAADGSSSAPFGLADRYRILVYRPREMSEALLLLDPQDYRLSGALQGNDTLLSKSSLFKLTTFEDWANFGASWYPTIVRTITLDESGEHLREKFSTTLSVQRGGPQPLSMFERASSPKVPTPVLPKVPYELPFSFLNDTVVLPCTGPDGTRQRLELDTGANVGLLRSDVAQRLGFVAIGDEEITGHGGVAAVSYARVEGFKLGGEVEIPAWPAAVLKADPKDEDSRKLEEALAANGVAGLLGNFLLNNFVVKLDYRRRVLTLYPHEEFDPDKHLSGRYYAIPVTRDSMPYAMVNVDGKIQGGAFFNTGAQQFFTLSLWAIDAAKTSYKMENFGTGVTVHGYTVFGIIRPGAVTLLGTAVGDHSDYVQSASNLTIPGLTIQEPTTHLELLAPGEAPNPHRVASFGNAFFQRFTVTFDLYHQMYYIEGA